MTRSLSTGRLAVAAAHAGAALAVHAPELHDAFTAALPEAADTVGRRLRGALVREDIGDARARHAGPGTRHGFDRVEFPCAGAGDPVDLLPGLEAPGFAAEIHNAVVKLAIAMARRPSAGTRRDYRLADSDPRRVRHPATVTRHPHPHAAPAAPDPHAAPAAPDPHAA
ncbi:MAG TPA: hypothetical protein VFR35_10255, partial [Actinoplanes sp.]|nr:hypothetical protein [Actinoplanes sp.]